MSEHTYGIDDGNGNQITTGLSPEIYARQVAQRMANERGESVYLYSLEEAAEAAREAEESDKEARDVSEEIEPTTDAERLARAAKHIDATDLGDGRWAHYADETGRWYVVDEDDLAELCDYLDDEDEQISRDAYSHWCAGTSAEEMPAGWDPGGAS